MWNTYEYLMFREIDVCCAFLYTTNFITICILLSTYVVVVHWRTKYCGFVTLKEPQNLLDMSSSDSCIGAQTSELRPLYVYYQSFVMLCFGLWSLRLPTLQKTTTWNLLISSVRPIPIYRPIISAKTADIIGRQKLPNLT